MRGHYFTLEFKLLYFSIAIRLYMNPKCSVHTHFVCRMRDVLVLLQSKPRLLQRSLQQLLLFLVIAISQCYLLPNCMWFAQCILSLARPLNISLGCRYVKLTLLI